MLMRKLYLIVAVLCICVISSSAFSQDSSGSGVSKVPSKYFETVSKRTSDLETKLDKSTQKALQALERQEKALKKKLSKIDSLAANNISTTSEARYKQLKEKLEGSKSLSQYIPRLDTLVTSFKFLQQNPQWL